jgi:UDP-N-acetylmuramate dehydrogenase
MTESSNIRENVDLAPMTTVGLGGSARYFAHWPNATAIQDTLLWAREKQLAVQVLGGGSNILFPDRGFGGVVGKVEIAGVDVERSDGWVTLGAGAGESWDEIVRRSVEAGFGGLECLSGIPGFVGATPIQNVGAYGQEVKDCIVQVEAIDRESLETILFSNEECTFGYRTSRFKTVDRDRYVITRVTYRLADPGRPQLRYPELARSMRRDFGSGQREGAEAMSMVRSAVLNLRRAKSMVLDPADENSRSMGSFFLNPVVDEDALLALRAQLGEDLPAFETDGGYKLPAAWLVERSGFAKGHRRGGAGISANHALALVNCGGSSSDLMQLAEDVRHAVFEISGIRLEPEPVIVADKR